MVQVVTSFSQTILRKVETGRLSTNALKQGQGELIENLAAEATDSENWPIFRLGVPKERASIPKTNVLETKALCHLSDYDSRRVLAFDRCPTAGTDLVARLALVHDRLGCGVPVGGSPDRSWMAAG